MRRQSGTVKMTRRSSAQKRADDEAWARSKAALDAEYLKRKAENAARAAAEEARRAARDENSTHG